MHMPLLLYQKWSTIPRRSPFKTISRNIRSNACTDLLMTSNTISENTKCTQTTLLPLGPAFLINQCGKIASSSQYLKHPDICTCDSTFLPWQQTPLVCTELPWKSGLSFLSAWNRGLLLWPPNTFTMMLIFLVLSKRQNDWMHLWWRRKTTFFTDYYALKCENNRYR